MGNGAHLNKDSSIPIAELFAGRREKPTAVPRRTPAGVNARAKQGDLPANRAAIRPGSGSAGCPEANGTALQREPANHTKSLATKSQVEFRFDITKKVV